MSIELTTHPQGVLLPVQGQPGARRNGVVGEHAGRLKVAVTQVAEKGKANQEIVKVLADAFGLSKSQVQLVSGETNSRKVFLLRGLSLEQIQQRIGEVLTG